MAQSAPIHPAPRIAIFAAVLLATLYRLFPVVAGMPALAQFFVTEDGYLMLTVARNIALGLGMSVSDGTIATNGVQPLATFLFAIPYALTEGSKEGGLVGLHIISTVVALGGFFAVRMSAARLLAPIAPGNLLPWIVATLWYCGPLLLLHTMNGLETGLCTLAVLLVLVQLHRVLGKGEQAGLGERLVLGAALGVLFLARIDTVFLIFSVFLAWLGHELLISRLGLRQVLGRLFPPALLSAALAAPWLLNNLINFGSIMPISGTAQAFRSEIGQNLSLLPAKLFEHFMPMLPVPGSIETNPALMTALGAFCVVVILWFTWRLWKAGGVAIWVFAAYAAYVLALSAYYGAFFGAPHFLGRYLAPTAPLLITASLVAAYDMLRAIAPRYGTQLTIGAGIGGIALSGVLLVRLLLPGVHDHEHFQVVEWVDAHAKAEDWVGAVQTGTLGYWHDRTINLDGKVNPAALAAILETGNVYAYVVQSDIAYLADWHGIASWQGAPDGGFGETFELVADDPEANLAAFQRR